MTSPGLGKETTKICAHRQNVQMRRANPLPEAIAHCPFSVAHARELGVERGRCRRSDLVKPFYGVRAADDPANLEELATAYSTRMSPDQFFSHMTSAALLGLRLPEGPVARDLHVSSVPPVAASHSRGVIGHQSTNTTPVVLANGLRVTAPIDTWFQLAPALQLDDLIVMGDGLLRRIHPFATLQQLKAAVRLNAGRRGQQRLLLALREMRAQTDSARETLLRLLVVRAGFPEPTVNARIVNDFGAVIAHADLAFLEFRTILEYDGAQHRTDARQFAIDIRRLDDLMEAGWRVIRVDKLLLTHPATLIAKIDKALRNGGWIPR